MANTTERERHEGEGRNERHRVRMESELLMIEAQVLRSQQYEHEHLKHRMAGMEAELNELHHRMATCELVDRDELERLRDADYHLSRLLSRVERSPLRLLARRRWGYRRMVETWL